MAYKIFTEEEWFDEFYPKSWGNWREYYNANAYRENRGESGCTWMDYNMTGYLLNSANLIREGMKVNKWPEGKCPFLNCFFIECGSEENGDISYFIQPYFQYKDKTYYAKVVISKIESNLNLYKIHISGNDDSSYTKHFIGTLDLADEILRIEQEGIQEITDRGYFFSN